MPRYIFTTTEGLKDDADYFNACVVQAENDGFYCQPATDDALFGFSEALSHAECMTGVYLFDYMRSFIPNIDEDWHCDGSTGYIRGIQNNDSATWINDNFGTSFAQGSTPLGPGTGVNYLVSSDCENDAAKLNQCNVLTQCNESAMFCDAPREGWADNSDDVDDNCSSNVYDCESVCDGTAELDDCDVCGGPGPAEGLDCDDNPLVVDCNEGNPAACGLACSEGDSWACDMLDCIDGDLDACEESCFTHGNAAACGLACSEGDSWACDTGCSLENFEACEVGCTEYDGFYTCAAMACLVEEDTESCEIKACVEGDYDACGLACSEGDNLEACAILGCFEGGDLDACDVSCFDDGNPYACDMGCYLGDSDACDVSCFDDDNPYACEESCFTHGNAAACGLACSEGDSWACDTGCSLGNFEACEVGCTEYDGFYTCAAMACLVEEDTESCEIKACVEGDYDACGLACSEGDNLEACAILGCFEGGDLDACDVSCFDDGNPYACDMGCYLGDSDACDVSCFDDDNPYACEESCFTHGNAAACGLACSEGDSWACDTGCSLENFEACEVGCTEYDSFYTCAAMDCLFEEDTESCEIKACVEGDYDACGLACIEGDNLEACAILGCFEGGDLDACDVSCFDDGNPYACDMGCYLGDSDACDVSCFDDDNPYACEESCFTHGNADACGLACIEGDSSACDMLSCIDGDLDACDVSCFDDGNCAVPGCTNSEACNFDGMATDDDGSCTYEVAHYADTDGDGLGSGESSDYCPGEFPEGAVTNSDDLEPECATNDTDDCGVCGGTAEVCQSTLHIDIASGWNWFSINLENENMDINDVLSTLTTPTQGDFIKSQSLSATYYEGFGWYGGLEVLGVTGMYKLNSANADILTFSGDPVAPASTPINLAAGWNWIGFTPQYNGPTRDALASIKANLDDFIKNQDDSATYYAGDGWYGGLGTMAPTEGYIISVDSAATLIYPNFAPEDTIKYTLNGTDLTINGRYTTNTIKQQHNMENSSPLADDDMITVNFILNRATDITDSNYISIETLLEKTYSEQQQYISNYKSDIPDWYGASQDDMNSFTQFMTANGLSIYDNSENLEQRSVSISATAETFSNVFLTHCSMPEVYSNLYLCPDPDETAHLTVDNTNIQSIIMGISNISSVMATTQKAENIAGNTNDRDLNTSFSSTNISTNPNVLYPLEVAKAYNFPTGSDNLGAGNTIGIVALYNDEATFAPTLTDYVNAQHTDLNYEATTQIETLGQPITTGSDLGEFDLDLSIISSIVPGATIKLLGFNSDNSSLYGTYALGIYDTEINIISSSYGSHTLNYQADVFEALYQDAILRDISTVVAAGDRGSQNAYSLSDFTGEPFALATNGAPSILSVGGSSFSQKITEEFSRKFSSIEGDDYPALLSVTTLTENDQTTWNQLEHYTVSQLTDYTINLASNYNSNSFAASNYPEMTLYYKLLTNSLTSSGQFNEDIYNIPSYQQNLPASFTSEGGAIYPHVTFLSGANQAHQGDTFYLIASDNGLTYSGGTSASAPLMASLVALTNTALTNSPDVSQFDGSLGFINTLLYKNYSENENFFIDIPSGSNNSSVTKLITPSPDDFSNWDYENAMITSLDSTSNTITIVPITGLDLSLYTTETGFDMATGLGSIDGGEFVTYFEDHIF